MFKRKFKMKLWVLLCFIIGNLASQYLIHGSVSIISALINAALVGVPFVLVFYFLTKRTKTNEN